MIMILIMIMIIILLPPSQVGHKFIGAVIGFLWTQYMGKRKAILQ